MTSLQVPFNVSNGRVLSTDDEKRVIEQKIINVLVTSRLERHMIPEYGAGAAGLLFDDIDELVEVDFKEDARAEVLARVSGVTIVDIKVERVGESQADLTVYYRMPLSPVQSMRLSVTVPGALTEESPIYGAS